MQSIFFCFSIKGVIEIAELLIKYGSNVNAIDDHKNTPLHFIGRIDDDDKQYAMAELLVNNFADTDAKNADDKTPFEMTRCQKSMILIDTKCKRKLLRFFF